MKRLLGLLLILVLMVLLCVGGVEWMWYCKEKNYYSDQSNFITITGTIYSVEKSSADTYWRIEFQDAVGIDDGKNYSGDYRLTGENLEIALANGLEKNVRAGKTVEFVTAPRVFGDGWKPPIVSITIDGICFLTFEDGYKNLMAAYE